jgi:kynurenine formamidase
VKERKIKAVGIDTPSIDFGQSKDFMTHRTLCGNNVTAYENVANLGQLPATGSYLVAAPMKIKGGSGSPLRLFAWVVGKR